MSQIDKNKKPQEAGAGANIFSMLSGFGLDAKSVEVYSAPEEAKPVSKGEEQVSAAVEIERGIYYRSFKCPICNAESKIPAIRSSSVRLLKNDTDFMPVYKDPNPLYYYIVFCKLCGFAAVPTAVGTLTGKQKQLIREKISSSWKFSKQYPTYYDPQTAVEIHKLALYNAVVANEKDSIRALISLRIGWLYRIAKDDENEKLFLNMAREGIERAYANESGSFGGLDSSRQQYLVGEIYRRVGDLPNALKWYRLVMVDREANLKVKEMAREQRDKVLAENPGVSEA